MIQNSGPTPSNTHTHICGPSQPPPQPPHHSHISSFPSIIRLGMVGIGRATASPPINHCSIVYVIDIQPSNTFHTSTWEKKVINKLCRQTLPLYMNSVNPFHNLQLFNFFEQQTQDTTTLQPRTLPPTTKYHQTNPNDHRRPTKCKIHISRQPYCLHRFPKHLWHHRPCTTLSNHGWFWLPTRRLRNSWRHPHQLHNGLMHGLL